MDVGCDDDVDVDVDADVGCISSVKSTIDDDDFRLRVDDDVDVECVAYGCDTR